MEFKRDIGGYYHYFILAGLLFYRAFIEDFGYLLPKLIYGFLFMLTLVLITRFISTIYLEVKDTELIIHKDFFTTKKILIDEIASIEMNRGHFSYGRIRMKNGSKVSLNSDYLKLEAKSILMNLLKK